MNSPTVDMLQLVWPLSFILVALFVLRQLRSDITPIFKSVVGGLSQNAARNATQYAIALGFGLSASLSAFWDVFRSLDNTTLGTMSWHQYFALWAKVANPFVVAILAYATQSNFTKTGATTGNTPPPFPDQT